MCVEEPSEGGGPHRLVVAETDHVGPERAQDAEAVFVAAAADRQPEDRGVGFRERRDRRPPLPLAPPRALPFDEEDGRIAGDDHRQAIAALLRLAEVVPVAGMNAVECPRCDHADHRQIVYGARCSNFAIPFGRTSTDKGSSRKG